MIEKGRKNKIRKKCYKDGRMIKIDNKCKKKRKKM